MAENIWNILSHYEHKLGTEKEFINKISQVCTSINDVHPQYGTPITHYCATHVRSKISYFVIKTLIVEFKANVNYVVAGQVPLTVILAARKHIQSNSKVITLLLEYTSNKTLLTVGDPVLLVQFLCSMDITAFVNIKVLASCIERMKQDDAANRHTIYKQLHTVKQQLWEHVLNIHSDKRIKTALQFAEYTFPFTLDIDQLFITAIQKQKTKFINTLLTLYPINVSVQPKHEQINICKLLTCYDDTRKYIQPSLYIKLQSIISDQMSLAKYYYKVGNTVAMRNIMFYIPDFINNSNRKEDALKKYTELADSMSQLIQQIKQDAKGDVISMIETELGFNNNIFHYLALSSSIRTNSLFDLAYATRPRLLFMYNVFGQSPLKIALLSNNQFFLSSVISVLSDNNKLNALDIDNNSIGHILAKTPELHSYFMQILGCVAKCYDAKEILSARNKFGHSPIHLAVQSNNINFIKWWENHGGNFDLMDKTYKTLWDYFIQSQVIKFNNDPTLNIHQEYVYDIHQEYVYDKLKATISSFVFNVDINNETPFYSALSSPAVLRRLLKDFGNKLNYAHQNKQGNTLSHILALNFKHHYNKHDYYINNIQKPVVNLLIPYSDEIKQHYHIKNKDDLSPSDIIAQCFSSPLALALHRKISHDILKQTAELIGISNTHSSKSYYDSTSSMLTVETIPLKLPVLEQKAFYDNKIIFFTSAVWDAMYKVAELHKPLQDIIYVLAFEIAYGKINQWDDTILNLLVSMQLVQVDVELTVCHILKILHPEIVKSILSTPNKLGMSLPHIAAQYDRALVSKYLLSIDKQIFCQPTQQIMFYRILNTDTGHPQMLNPYDYAVIYKSKKVLRLLGELKTSIEIKSHLKSIALGLRDKDIYDYLADLNTGYNRDINFEWLQNKNLHFIKILERKNTLNDYHYFPINQYQLTYLNIKYDLLLYENEFFYSPSLRILRNHLVMYKASLENNNSNEPNRVMAIFLGHDQHASSLLVFKDIANQFHALLHDSMYMTSNTINDICLKRAREIQHILFEELLISQDHIYILQAPQQDAKEFNCGLWTTANLKFMIAHLFESKWDCLGCFNLLHTQSLVSSMNSKILDKIEESLITKSPLLVNVFEQSLLDAHHTGFNLKNSVIMFEKFFNSLINNEHTIVSDDDRRLSDQDIHTVIEMFYKGTFSVHGNDAYTHAIHDGLVIVSDPISNHELVAQIQSFVNLVQTEYSYTSQDRPLHAKRTFIINLNNDHWVTLVIVLDSSNTARVYFADSYARNISKHLNDAVQRTLYKLGYTELVNKSVVLSQQQNDQYNCGLWAIKNAIYITKMLDSNSSESDYLSRIKQNIVNDRKFIITMKEDIKDVLEPINHSLESMSQALQSAIQEIDLSTHTSSCMSSFPMILSDRRKRAICDAKESTKLVDHSTSVLEMSETNQIRMQLYFNKAFLSLTDTQLHFLKQLIQQYKFSFDDTYKTKISDTKSLDIKSLINYYHDEMKKKLQNVAQFTLETIEKLTWETLDHFMESCNIPYEVRTSALHHMRSIHKLFIHNIQKQGHKIAQVSNNTAKSIAPVLNDNIPSMFDYVTSDYDIDVMLSQMYSAHVPDVCGVCYDECIS